jgi:hypothetical protein
MDMAKLWKDYGWIVFIVACAAIIKLFGLEGYLR